MKIEITPETAQRIKKNDKNLEGANAVINRALRALERTEGKSITKNFSNTPIISGMVNDKHLKERKWKPILIEILRTLGHRKDEFNTFPSTMIKRGHIRKRHYEYVKEIDMSVPGLSIDRAQRLIELVGKHFNLYIEIRYQDEGEKVQALQTQKPHLRAIR